MTLYTHTYRRPRSRVAALLSRWWRRLLPRRPPAVAPSRRHALMAAVDARRDDVRDAAWR